MGFLLAIIYLSFISLGLPDALLGGSVAEYLSGISGSCFVCRDGVHDYFVWYHRVESAERSSHEEIWNRYGDRRECGDDRTRAVGLLDQPQLHFAVSVGDPVRTGCGQRGCFAQ